MQAVIFHVNRVSIAMVFANLLELLILFLSKETMENSSENKTTIVLESFFHCIRLAAIQNCCVRSI